MTQRNTDIQRVRFTAEGWEYTQSDDGLITLAEVEEQTEPLHKRILNSLTGDISTSFHSRFEIEFDTVVGASEPDPNALQHRYTFYRNGVKVASINDVLLPEVILNYLRKHAIHPRDFN